MNAYDLIDKKKRGLPLSDSEIMWFTSSYLSGDILDYQVSAMLMAICLNGMTKEETYSLTNAITHSGETLTFDGIEGVRVDKHSTGGVGDKTSLIVAPIVASLGVKVAKISGRGLGHTGGTIDKLESIDGFDTSMDKERFESIVNDIGIAIIGQTSEIAPLDRRLYALRDVTATIDSIPLIASSIMGKKLAVGDDGIVLDVKCGRGAFMKTLPEARGLARAMVDIGVLAGKRTCALITDMDAPLGYAIGNALEVREAIEVLKGADIPDLRELCIALSSRMISLATEYDIRTCVDMCTHALDSGMALDKFRRMVVAQGGDASIIEETDRLLGASYAIEVLSDREGYISSQDAESYGKVSLLLGAGRVRKDDVILPYVGIILNKKVGDYLHIGESIATLYLEDDTLYDTARDMILFSTTITDTPPTRRGIVLDEIV